ncbi:MAG: hypothetical protein WBW71_04140 [Bacteroidota bacterium]
MDAMGYAAFNSDANLKARLASSYGADGNDLIGRVHLVRRNSDATHRSHYAKIIVDCIMACECSMKSLIFSLSKTPETPEGLYRLVRRRSHHLKRLLDEVKPRARNRIRLLTDSEERLLLDVDSLGVESRYTVEVFFTLMNEENIARLMGAGQISGTIDNNDWCNRVVKLSSKMVSLAKTSNERYMQRYTGFLGDHRGEQEQRYHQFAMDVGII